ncbi:YafY family protein [Allomuricauda sp. d1]|uniref:helix-turn-helix transcriptional regulator n=1 Tax=Allomuricauda sp. d1 TaxID=3136725 RepID=UPI0031D31411
MKRLHRLTALLIEFQTNKSLKVRDLSKSFGVTTRTIYRDINALEEAGVPIGYEPGEDYFLLEGYQVAPVHFTPEEANALITAKAIIGQNSDASLSKAFTAAVNKVRAVLRTTEKESTYLLEKRIAPSKASQNQSDTLMAIQKAIGGFTVLFMEYRTADGSKSQRQVEPLALYFTQEHWILVAYCQLRKANREFRLDRIIKLSPIDENFPPNQFTLDDYFKKNATSKKS